MEREREGLLHISYYHTVINYNNLPKGLAIHIPYIISTS
jgi:hypothetical protein